MSVRFKTLPVAGLVFLLAGCLHDSGGLERLGYGGLTSQGVVTAANGETLATGAWQGTASGEAANGLPSAVIQHSDGTLSGKPFPIELAEMLNASLAAVQFGTADNDISAMGVSHSFNTTINGSCGGSATMSYTVSSDMTSFTGSSVYNGYCEQGVVMNGSMSFTMNMDTMETVMTMAPLEMTVCGETMTVDGTMTMSTLGGLSTVTNMLFKQGDSGKVYRLENYTVSVTPGSGFQDMSLSGRYYDPDIGYVELTTPTPIRINDTDMWPSSGVLRIDGAASHAILTFNSATDYFYSIDEGNDGYEVSNVTGTWPAGAGCAM